ncbi:YaaA family protein [Amnibacterium sp.]|uniref:YaaA family protein n=1 Tax=Amnibacterium sp. TaxID=1872496 RepID=UPI002606EF98|nr:peroxide stress protein YaaA [Amnibacterium sp.]MCU1475054.1 peroxide stress protein YaaA [Amnibacterium sp.]
MKLLLPPSESKSDGGSGRFALGRLSRPALNPARSAVLEALVTLARDPGEAARVLHLGPKQVGEIDRNAHLRRAPVLPAVERYTGVVYEALDAGTLPDSARAWLDGHLLIASALLGLVAPHDPIPAYRLSGGSALPGLPLKRHWSEPLRRALARERDWVLDARSAAYAALGPAPAGSAVLLVEDATSGRALNHCNKHAKGDLARRLALEGPEIRSRDDLLAWAPAAGLRLEPRGTADVALIVPATEPTAAHG